MKIITAFFLLATASLISTPATAKTDCHELLNFTATKLRSTEKIEFCQRFSGKALLVVNTASQCGFTPQFKGLEKLHQEYGDKLAIIGFPSNDFRQEHSDSEKVADVCYVNYGVTFTMLEPSSVLGENANKVFKMLSQQTAREPGWNFTKYLVSADGKTIKHFASATRPMSKEIRSEIDALLATR
ncbi:MAG: glutathione peroxidase [Arenicella sp.]|jgi:glutathione peroxidase